MEHVKKITSDKIEQFLVRPLDYSLKDHLHVLQDGTFLQLNAISLLLFPTESIVGAKYTSNLKYPYSSM